MESKMQMVETLPKRNYKGSGNYTARKAALPLRLTSSGTHSLRCFTKTTYRKRTHKNFQDMHSFQPRWTFTQIFGRCTKRKYFPRYIASILSDCVKSVQQVGFLLVLLDSFRVQIPSSPPFWKPLKLLKNPVISRVFPLSGRHASKAKNGAKRCKKCVVKVQ